MQADFEQIDDENVKHTPAVFQLFQTYIVTKTGESLILINQQRAHERVLYEKFSRSLANHSGASQQLLFPQQLTIKAGELALLHDYMDDLRMLGFDIEPLGQNTLVIQGIPLAMAESESMQALEEIMEGLKHNKVAFDLNKNHQLAFLLAKHGAIKTGKTLSTEEMLHLADQLFACEMPNLAPNGKPVVIHLRKTDFEKQFN
jgi:DNA mismatch repair protein MutL